MLRLLGLLLCFWLAALPLHAATKPSQPGNPRLELDVATGPQTGTYHRFGEDIARVTAASNIILSVRESAGSIDNLKRISKLEGGGLGIVQSDLLSYLRRSEKPASRQLASRLRVVFPFYREEVHLLARQTITSVQQLHGKRLIVGPEGSGHWLTAMNLLAMLEIKPASIQRLPMEEAALAVLRDRADALLFVGGKPVKLFENMGELGDKPEAAYRQLLTQVHFLPLNDKRLLADYEMAEIAPGDYPFVNQPVPTIALRAVMVTALPEKIPILPADRCNALGGIGLALRANLDYLKDYGHPKWSEVDLERRSLGQWKAEPCVDRFRQAATTVNDPLEKDLLQAIEKRW